jgi:osmoprotectant transport system permease protein
MIALTAEAEIDRKPFAEVARGFLARQAAAAPSAVSSAASSATPAPAAGRPGFVGRPFAPDLPRLLPEHLALVFGSLVLAVAVGVGVGVGVGVWAQARPRAGAVLRGAVGLLLQTVPSLALLGVLVVLVALVALLGRIGCLPVLLAVQVQAGFGLFGRRSRVPR